MVQIRSRNGAVFQRVLKSRKLETGELEFDTDYARSIRTCNQRAVGFAEYPAGRAKKRDPKGFRQVTLWGLVPVFNCAYTCTLCRREHTSEANLFLYKSHKLPEALFRPQGKGSSNPQFVQLTTRLTCRYSAVLHSGRVQRFVRFCYYVPKL